MSLRLAIENPGRVERLGLVAPAGLGSAPPWWWHALTARPHLAGRPVDPLAADDPLVQLGLKAFLALRLFDNPRRLDEEINHLVGCTARATT